MGLVHRLLALAMHYRPRVLGPEKQAGALARAADLHLQEPWMDFTGSGSASTAARADFHAELRREVRRGHALAGVGVIVAAARGDCDDVLLVRADGSWAITHLTWQGRQRTPWPDTRLYSSTDELLVDLYDGWDPGDHWAPEDRWDPES